MVLTPSCCSGFDCDWRITGELILRLTVRPGQYCRGQAIGKELAEGGSGASLVYTLGLSFVELVRWSSGVF